MLTRCKLHYSVGSEACSCKITFVCWCPHRMAPLTLFFRSPDLLYGRNLALGYSLSWYCPASLPPPTCLKCHHPRLHTGRQRVLPCHQALVVYPFFWRTVVPEPTFLLFRGACWGFLISCTFMLAFFVFGLPMLSSPLTFVGGWCTVRPIL